MTVQMVASPENASREDDYVTRQRKEHARRVDFKDVFKTETVSVEDGPVQVSGVDKGKRAMSKITLRFALDQPFVFAVYSENPLFHVRGREEWMAAAGDAIEKLAAVRDIQIKSGPRPEDMSRYNVMAELSAPLAFSTPETRAIAGRDAGSVDDFHRYQKDLAERVIA